MLDLITVGDASIDTFCLLDHEEADVQCNLDQTNCRLSLDYADKIPLKAMHHSVGGNAANVAVGAARLGLRASMVSTIGADEPSRKVIHTLEQENVDLNNLRRDGKTNQSVALIYQGERTLLVRHEPREYFFDNIPPAKWLYLTSLARGGEKIIDNIIKYSQDNNTKLVFAPGTLQLRLGAERYRNVLEATDIIILNRAEAIAYTGSSDKTEIPKLLEALIELGPEMAIITDGVGGSFGYDGGQLYQCAASPARKIETTGAGDAYASGLIAALNHRHDIGAAMKWGSIDSASVVQYIGPQKGLLTLPQISQLLENKTP